ncbi:MAG: GAF domain-containing protein [Balneolaceae bacterium]|nr:GAF domain-containing protein [Balneolaceae bacterium]
METYTQARHKERSNADIMGKQRQEKSLREFKEVLDDLVFMLRRATGMRTVSLYWVNRQRGQFVLETQSTDLENVMFQDRLAFGDDLPGTRGGISRSPPACAWGRRWKPASLPITTEKCRWSTSTLLPFLNNGETGSADRAGIRRAPFRGEGEVVHAYINGLRNVLNTYLEISDLYERQEEWLEYEERVKVIETKGHAAKLIHAVMDEIQEMLHDGGVCFVGKAMGSWCHLMKSTEARHAPPLGMPLEQRTLGYDALESGSPEFAIHFNNNPKRLSPRERKTEGATLAVPLLMDDRRQGLLLVYDRNPLVFKESTKHKIVNLVRLAALKLGTRRGTPEPGESIVANEYGGVLPDLWEIVVDGQLQALRRQDSSYHSWFGLLTLSDLSELRTRLRLEELQALQRDLISACNPSHYGWSGYIGSHADYVYAIFLQSADEDAFKQWVSSVKKELDGGLELSNGRSFRSGVQVGFTSLKGGQEDSYEVLSHAKTALSRAVKSKEEEEED